MCLMFFIGKNKELNKRLQEFCLQNKIKLLKQFDNCTDAENFLGILEPDYLLVEQEIEKLNEFVEVVYKNYSSKIILFKELISKDELNRDSAITMLSYDFLFSDLKNIINEDEHAFLYRNTNKFMDLESAVSDFCLEVGIMPNLSGYRYVVSAIMLVISDIEKYRGLTKNLYPAIAQKFGVNSCVVERTIRHALISASQSGKLMKLNKLIKLDVFSKNDRISNGQFIFIVADRFLFNLKLINGKNDFKRFWL